jgi:hypothetical protein
MTNASLPQTPAAEDASERLLQLHRRIIAVTIVLLSVGACWFVYNNHQETSERRADQLECLAMGGYRYNVC